MHDRADQSFVMPQPARGTAYPRPLTCPMVRKQCMIAAACETKNRLLKSVRSDDLRSLTNSTSKSIEFFTLFLELGELFARFFAFDSLLLLDFIACDNSNNEHKIITEHKIIKFTLIVYNSANLSGF